MNRKLIRMREIDLAIIAARSKKLSCEGCKHWGGVLPIPKDKLWRACFSVSSDLAETHNKETLFYLACPGSDVASLRTHKTFYCKHWEKREGGESE